MTRRRKRTNNPQRPPRTALVVLIRPALASRLRAFARDERKSVSRLVNDWLSDALEISEKDR